VCEREREGDREIEKRRRKKRVVRRKGEEEKEGVEGKGKGIRV